MSLNLFRSRNQWVTKLILIVIAVVFTFGFGYSFINFGSLGGASEGIAAEVNGEAITITEYYRIRDNMSRQFQQQGEIPVSLLNYINIRALNQLIDLKLLYQKAKELGLEITDEELKQAIMSNPAFQIDGEFIGFSAYKNFIQEGLRENVGEFEKKYKEELLAQKLIGFINETAKISDEELLNLFRIQNERVKISYIEFSPENYVDNVEIIEDEIKKHYESNKDKYYIAETRSIKYIVLTPADFEKKVSVKDEEVEAYYDSYKEEFKDSDNNFKTLDDVKEDIKLKIAGKRKQTRQAEFVDNLDNILSTSSLEEISKDYAIKELKEVEINSSNKGLEKNIPNTFIVRANSLQQGEKFYILSSSDIWIAQINDIKPQKPKEYSEAKEQVMIDLKNRKSKNLAKKEAYKIHKELLNSNIEFAELKDLKGLKINETDYFTRLEKIDGIVSNDLKLDAFLLTADNPQANKVYNVEDKYYIYRLKDKKKIDEDEFEDNKEQIRYSILTKRKNYIYNNWLISFRKKAEIVPNVNLFPSQG